MMNGDVAAVRSSFCCFFVIVVIACAALIEAGPVSIYSAMSPFGRNIRPIACKSKAGDEGVCMFAMDCTRMNGIHLGTCIDRFYFGSCCAPTSPLQAAEFGIVPSNGIGDLSSRPPTTTTTTTTTMSTTTPSVISSSTTTGINLNVPNDILTTIISLQPQQPAVTTTTPISSTTAEATIPPSPTTSTTGLPSVVTSTPGTSINTTLAPPPSSTTQSSSSTTSTSTVPTTTITTLPDSTITTNPSTSSSSTTTATTTTSTGAAAIATATSTNPPLTTTNSTLATPQQPVELIVPTTDTPSSSFVELESITTTIEPFLPTDADSSTESGVELLMTTAQPEEGEGIETTEDTTEAVKQEATHAVSSSPSLELVTPSSTTSSSSTTVSPSSSTALPSSSSSASVSPDVSSTTTSPTDSTSTSTTEPSAPLVELTTVDAGLITTAAGNNNNETTEQIPQNPDYRQVCGRPQYRYPTARIVGGTTTQYGQWPWQISLRQWRTATFLHKCGAALLNENWAITAAHCVDNVQPDDLLLRMGEYDLATDEEEYPYVERKVQIVASHPQFDSRTFEYDLALLRFYDPVRFQPNIIPICLPPVQPETDYVGQTAYVTGWGRLYEDGPLPSKMQQVSVPVINNTECENMYRRAGYVEHIPNIFICAGYSEGKRDSCEGDSGGPMVIHGNNTDHWVLAGVISWGIGCAEANQPGVYTRISEFREWIDKIIVF